MVYLNLPGLTVWPKRIIVTCSVSISYQLNERKLIDSLLYGLGGDLLGGQPGSGKIRTAVPATSAVRHGCDWGGSGL